MVGTVSALEAIDSQEDLVSCSDLGKVFRSEGPRHIPHNRVSTTSAFSKQAFRLSRVVVLFPNETDPSVDFEREVIVFVDNAA